MLKNMRQYEAAKREVARLGKLIKSGEATERDRRRYYAGGEEIVCFEWELENRRSFQKKFKNRSAP